MADWSRVRLTLMAAIASAVLTLMACGGDPTPTVVYSQAELATWRDVLSEAGLEDVPGWRSSGTAVGHINIEVWAQSGARDRMEAFLADVDVPRQAIVLTVGCSEESVWPPDGEWKRPHPSLSRLVEHSMDPLASVAVGDTVMLKQTLKNVSDEEISVPLGYYPHDNFIIRTAAGRPVWHWLCGAIRLLPVHYYYLAPGEVLEFVGEWDLVNNRGEPVHPGYYTVRGTLDVGWGEGNVVFMTDPIRLRVER